MGCCTSQASPPCDMAVSNGSNKMSECEDKCATPSMAQPILPAADNKTLNAETYEYKEPLHATRISQTTRITLARQPGEPIFGFSKMRTCHDGFFAVIDVHTGGPASRAGLRVGDIVRVNTASADRMELGVWRPDCSLDDKFGKTSEQS